MGPIIEFRNCENFRPRHLLENTFEKSFDSAPGPQPHVPRLLKASSNLSLAEERGLDDPAASPFKAAFKSPCTYTEVRPALPPIIDHPR